MKRVRLIALGLIAAVVVRQILQNHGSGVLSKLSQASVPKTLLPARTAAPSSPRQGAVANRDTHLPDYTPHEPRPAERQPENTPAAQQLSST
jgi:hypothetical protein